MEDATANSVFDNVTAIFPLGCAAEFFAAMMPTLFFSMLGDCADYPEWKNGCRATSLIYSTGTFVQKTGGGFAGALVLIVLANYGYNGKEPTTIKAALPGMVLLMSFIPAVFSFCEIDLIEVSKGNLMHSIHNNIKKISVKEKIAYGLGDTASNIIFQTVMMFLLLFYTDIVGISPAVVGTMFLAVRIIDAITDPLMGNLADKTTSKWGHYRPYLLWLALPFALISILTFTTPQFTGSAKIAYAFTTYTILMIAYTAINIPYCALGGVLTANAKERVSIQSYRFVFGMLGGVIVAAGTMPLVALLGDGDNAKGYQLTMIVMSAIGFILFLLCFLGTKERISNPVEQSVSFKESLPLLWKNDQWRILCIAALFLLAGQVLRLTLAVYYVKYFLGREDLITLFLTLGLIGSLVGSGLAQLLVKYFCKIKAYIALQLIAAVICALSFFIEKDQLVLAFTSFIAWKFFLDMASPLLWAKMTDTIDYGHHKTGVRITGMIYSGVIFFIKMGVAIGGALAGWLLSYYGYHAAIGENSGEQTAITQQGILLSFSVFPAIGSLFVAGLMSKYNLTDQKITDIQRNLNISVN